jgi:hypothetical protein
MAFLQVDWMVDYLELLKVVERGNGLLVDE